MRRNRIDISTIILCAIFLGIIAGFGGIYFYMDRTASRVRVDEAVRAQQEAAKIPVVRAVTPVVVAPAPTNIVTTSTKKNDLVVEIDVPQTGAINLNVPFFPQAPKKNWDPDHEEYCEEAALLGVHLFMSGKKYSIDEMETELEKMRDFEIKTFGYFESTDVEKVARVAREYLKYKKIRVIENPTAELIRSEIVAGRPVIVPANGKLLKNPYFKNGGPTYHMVVVRGFTERGDVITNDPGTQHGENFVYKRDLFFAAIYDWDHEQDRTKVATGKSRALVIE